MGAFSFGVCLWHVPRTKELDVIIEVCYNTLLNELLVDRLAAKRSQHSHSNQSLSGPVQAWRFRGADKATRQEVNASLPLTLSGAEVATQKKSPAAAIHSKAGTLPEPK